MEIILNDIIHPTTLMLIGLGFNLAGVCLLAYEVRLAQNTEFFFLYMRQALRQAENLHTDPVDQGRKDLEAARKDMDKKTPEEQLAWRMQEAILRGEVPAWLADGIKEQAENLVNDIRQKNAAFDHQAAPHVLERRRSLLRLGVLLIIIGIVLQGVATQSG